MEKIEIDELYSQICEDINTITINHFIKLNKLQYGNVYKFIKNKPKLITDGRFLKNLQRYHKILYGHPNKKLNLLIK